MEGLLLVKAEGQEVEEVAAVARVLAQGRPVTVRTAALCSAVALAESLAAALRTDWVVDGNWDPLRTASTLSLLDASSIHHLYPAIKVLNLASNSSVEEREVQFSQRLHLNLRTHYPGFQVILTADSTVLSTLALLHHPLKSVSMAALVLEGSAWRVARVYESGKDVADFMLAVPLRESHNGFFAASKIDFETTFPQHEIEAESGKTVSMKPLELLHSEEIPGKVAAEIREMMHHFGKSLQKLLNVEEFTEEEKQKYAEIKRNLDGNMYEMERKLTEVTNQVQGETQVLETTRNSLRSEITALVLDFQSASTAQNQLKLLISAVSTSLQPALGLLSSQLQEAESTLTTQKDALAVILKAQKTVKPVFQLGPVITLQSTVITTNVTKTKTYRVDGKVVVSGNEEEIKQIPLDLSQSSEVELGSVLIYKPGEYQVCVRTAEGVLISNVVTFTVDVSQSLPKPATAGLPGTYQDSFLYKSLGTIDDIEHQIVEKAQDSGLALFRLLATTWTDPDHNRIQQFLDICLQSLEAGEEAIRKEMQAQGFSFRP